MTRSFETLPNITRPLGVSVGAPATVSENAWDFYLAVLFGDVETRREIHAINPNVTLLRKRP